MLRLYNYYKGESDWNDVVMECSSLSAKWDDISIYLGLSANKIDAIRRDCGSTQHCWNQALLVWINQGYDTSKFGKPSWRTLVRAIGKENWSLSEKLRQKHRSKQS